MAFPSRRVLVTGAAGFTGRHLCAHLREHGFEVVGVTDQACSTDNLVTANLLDADALAAAVREAAPDCVVHLAAIAFPGHTNAAEVYRVNLSGTLSLLEALAALPRPPDAVLLPSTATVYAGSTVPITESSPIHPSTHYAVSKLAMEHMARLFSARLPVIVVRPFNYTGPGQQEPYLIPKIVRHFADRAEIIELGNVDVERDFLDVRAVVDAYRRVLETPSARGQTYNICSGAGTTMRGVVESLSAITGTRMEIRINPQFVRAGEPQRIVGSADKLRRAIGELATRPLTATLADMLADIQT